MKTLLLIVFILGAVCPAAANVTGIVRGVQENPIPGALVTFTSEANPADSYSGYTDAGGRYDIAITALSVGDIFPAPFILRQNHPNPFNPSTTITFATAAPGFATLAVYNIIGQRVRTLVSGTLPAGEHIAVWDGRDDAGSSVGAGVYLYRLTEGGRAETKKMLLIDGVAASGGVAGTVPQAAKSAAATWTVTITGDEIEPREMNGLEIEDEGNYDFYVIFTGELLNFHLVQIPGGTFEMGRYPLVDFSDTTSGPGHWVILDDFEIGAFEITNAQYAQYLNEALAAGEVEMVTGDPYGKGGEWDGKQYIDLYAIAIPDRDCKLMYENGVIKVEEAVKRNWPVVAVSWYGAKAFAVHYGLDLPTEAEWEYAAGGGALEYEYATDDGTYGPEKVNSDNIIGHPIEVGDYPPNPFGLYDMTGNVEEWCNDWFSRYPCLSLETHIFERDWFTPPTEPVVNPTGPETGQMKVRRGGCYSANFYIKTTFRLKIQPEILEVEDGFRVVRRPE